MDISVSTSGSTNKTEAFLEKILRGDIYAKLSEFGREGVRLLSSATPVDTGETAHSWDFKVVKDDHSYSVVWTNHNTDRRGVPIAILIQYGHGTGTGGYVQGRDFINPVMQPLFDRMARDMWKAVTSG